MHSFPLRITNETKNKYRNLKELLKDCEDTENYIVCIDTVNGLDDINNEMPFYFDGSKFVDDMKYIDLNFSEYSIYELENTEISLQYGYGKGAGEFTDIVEFIQGAIKALDVYFLDKPLTMALYAEAINLIIRGLKELDRRFLCNYRIIDILHFTKRNGIKLKGQQFVKDYNSLSKRDQKEIDKGIGIIQDLYNKGILESNCEEFINKENKRMNDYYNSKDKKGDSNDTNI